MLKLKPGVMVRLLQKHTDIAIKARRAPESVGGPRHHSNVIICEIPHDSQALYISTRPDAFNAAIRGRGRGPYGYTPVENHFHLVLWEGRPVWVASHDTDIETL